MRVRGDNGCDKLVHVRRGEKPLESGGGREDATQTGDDDCKEWLTERNLE